MDERDSPEWIVDVRGSNCNGPPSGGSVGEGGQVGEVDVDPPSQMTREWTKKSRVELTVTRNSSDCKNYGKRQETILDLFPFPFNNVERRRLCHRDKHPLLCPSHRVILYGSEISAYPNSR